MTNVANYVQEGASLDYTPVGAVDAGDVVLQNGLVGMTKLPIAASKLGALTVQGVFDFAKATGGGTAIAAGKAVYWDAVNEIATETAGGNKLLGRSIKAAADGDARVRVRVTDSAPPSLIYSAAAASAAVTNTTAETAFDKSTTIPANTLQPGDVIRVRLQGIVTAQNSTDTLNVKLYLGSVEIAATGAVDAGTNDIFYIDYDITIRTIGATGTLVGAGATALGAVGTVTAKPALKASTAVDTTAANAVAVKATWSVANAGNSCRLDVLNVQLLSKS